MAIGYGWNAQAPVAANPYVRRMPGVVSPADMGQEDYQQPAQSPYPSFDQIGAGAAMQPQQSLFSPIGEMGDTGALGDYAGDQDGISTFDVLPTALPQQDQQPGGQSDLPSMTAIERRQKLAQALMGRKMEVNHPVQALANAVGDIAGAYIQKRADDDLRKVEDNRRNVMRQALKNNPGNFSAAMEEMMQSGDPEIVDMGLKFQLESLAGGKSRKAPQIVTKYNADGTAQQMQWDDDMGDFVPFSDRYPREVGGSLGTGNEKTQKGDWVFVGDKRVFTEFVPGRGMMMRDDTGNLVPLPKDVQSENSMLSPAAFRKEIDNFQRADQALKQLDSYFQSVKGTNVGYKRWSDTISAHVKTLLQSGGVQPRYTNEELALMQARGQLQGLLGLFREDVVGGGVMTEYDAVRILQRLGGDVTALQNPQVVEPLLRELYQSKQRTRDVSRSILEYNRPRYPGLDMPVPMAPDYLGGPAPSGSAVNPSTNQASGGGSAKPKLNAPPLERRVLGKTEIKIGEQVFVWSRNANGELKWMPK